MKNMDKYLLPSAIILAAILYAWVNSTEIVNITNENLGRSELWKHNKITNTTYRVNRYYLIKWGENGVISEEVDE